VKLGELTWKEAAAARDKIVLVPVGATEAHGPHLPIATDCIIAEEMARRAAETLGAIVAPTVSYSRADYAAGFSGTVSLAAVAFEAHLGSVLAGLRKSGFAKLCLVNAHIEPAHLESLRRVCQMDGAILPDKTERRWRHKLREVQGIDGHAGAYETALVMVVRPDLVRTPLPPDSSANLLEAMKAGAKTFEEAGAPDAYFGQPSKATRELGERIYAILAEMIVTVCGESFTSSASAR
jgi:creatinine amidohydrolase